MTRSLFALAFALVTACSTAPLPAAPTLDAQPVKTNSDATTAANAQTSSATERCVVTVEEICSPYARGTRRVPGRRTRWARATYSGNCGSADPEWEITPDPKTAWPEHEAQAFSWHHDSRVGYFRGECGDYLVRARAPEPETPRTRLPFGCRRRSATGNRPPTPRTAPRLPTGWRNRDGDGTRTTPED